MVRWMDVRLYNEMLFSRPRAHHVGGEDESTILSVVPSNYIASTFGEGVIALERSIDSEYLR